MVGYIIIKKDGIYQLKQLVDHISTPRDTLLEEVEHVRVLVRRAFKKYGRDHVFNQDETPLKLVCPPSRSNSIKGKKRAHKIKARGCVKQQLTASLTISATGQKLNSFIIKKSKATNLLNSKNALRSLKLDKFKHLNGFITRKVWTNEYIMLETLTMIYAYVGGEPCCLLMDGYAAHWTDNVVERAKDLNIELIRLPAGITSHFQPLDIYVNGVLKKKQQAIQTLEKQKDPTIIFKPSDSIRQFVKAYKSIGEKEIADAWGVFY